MRPELVRIAAVNGASSLSAELELSARVKNRIFLGQQTEYLVETDELGEILVLASKQAESLSGGFSPGDVVKVGWDHDAALAFAQDLDGIRSTVAADPESKEDG